MKEQAIEQSKNNPKNHYSKCYSYSLEWIKNTNKQSFSSEDIINDFDKETGLLIKDYRVFGSVIRELKKIKMISHYGYEKYKNPAGHGKPCNVWRKN
jgi:hypothetical protein